MTKTGYKLDNQTIPIYIQTPKLKTSSGIILNDTRSYIDLELDKNHLGFYEFITNLDEQNLTTIVIVKNGSDRLYHGCN